MGTFAIVLIGLVIALGVIALKLYQATCWQRDEMACLKSDLRAAERHAEGTQIRWRPCKTHETGEALDHGYLTAWDTKALRYRKLGFTIDALNRNEAQAVKNWEDVKA